MPQGEIRLLLIEDNQGDARLIREMLRDEEMSESMNNKFELTHVETLAKGQIQLVENKFDLVLLDLGLPDSQGFRTFLRLYTHEPNVPIIILSGYSEREMALKAVREGAQDYLVKGQVSSYLFVNAIQYAIERKETEKKITRMSWLYSVLSEINEIIVRHFDRDKLFEAACRIVVDYDLFKIAWIGLVNPDRKTMTPVRFYGFREGIPEGFEIPLDCEDEKLCPEAKAIKTGDCYISNNITEYEHIDIWRKELVKNKCYSNASFPIRLGSEVIGAFNVSASNPSFFDYSVIYLLNKLSDNISFAMHSIELEEKRRIAEKRLLEERNFVTAILDIIAAMVVVFNRDGQIIRFNRACEDLSGYSSKEVEGHFIWDIVLSEEDSKELKAIFKDVLSGKPQSRYENTWETKYNDKRLIEWSNTSLLDEYGEVEFIICSGIDITDRKAAEEKIRFLAFHDNLTGLPNRRLFFDRLSFSLPRARRYNHFIALLYIDLDGFKEINDTFGHEAGDYVLREVSERTKLCLRDMDTLARLGGDEFAVILQDLDQKKSSEIVAQRILKTLNEPFIISDQESRISASIGISTFPDDGNDAEELLKNADTAMYKVKRKGKNDYHFYSVRSTNLERESSLIND